MEGCATNVFVNRHNRQGGRRPRRAAPTACQRRRKNQNERCDKTHDTKHTPPPRRFVTAKPLVTFPHNSRRSRLGLAAHPAATAETRRAASRRCSVNHYPEHPARSDATDEEGVLRKACAADVRQPDERHEASLPRPPAATACDRAKGVPQNRDDWISAVLPQPRRERWHCERYRSSPRSQVVRWQREQVRAGHVRACGWAVDPNPSLFTSSG